MAYPASLHRCLAVLALSFLIFCTCAQASAIAEPRHSRPRRANIAPRAIPTQAPSKFVHPGVFIQKSQLDYVAGKVNSGAQPWSNAFTSMMNYNYSSPTRAAKPYATVACGASSTPNVGCYQEREDSMAAYINALAFTITKKKAYADKSIYYMDAWSAVVQKHTMTNGPIQSAWSASNWVRAAEIMRYAAGGGWTDKGIKAFEDMLRRVYVPVLENGNGKINGNWELVMNEAALFCAVFLEDKALYTKSMSFFAQRVPAYIYLTSDGAYPVAARGNSGSKSSIVKFWFGQSTFPVSGITQETCRDFAHTGYGVASMAHVAETARIHGIDLWSTDLGTRVKAALELHSPFITGDEKIPSWLCAGVIPRTLGPVLEPPYNALVYRKGQSMPKTKKLLLQQRPAQIGEKVPLFWGFETLTNAEVPY